jgi:hypothetical protein
MAGLLEAAVHLLLNQFPDAVTVGLDDHAAAYRRVVHQIGLQDDVGIPLGKILVARRNVRDKFLLLVLLAHHRSPLAYEEIIGTCRKNCK